MKSIHHTVRTQIAVAALISLSARGHVSGFVNDGAQIDRAVTPAQSVKGVVSVQNRLEVKVGDTTVGSNVDDTVVTSRVKTALMADKSVNGSDIRVETRKGVVMLSGFVANKSQISNAEKLAAMQEGAQSVRNELSVKK